jgi:hypothetical protein
MKDKIAAFAKLVEEQQIQYLIGMGYKADSNFRNAKTQVLPGKKFAKVNIGDSGRYMVEMSTGNIFGTKGYGQVHRGHFYGTVDTINEYFWGEYYPERLASPLPKQGSSFIPKLTHAPEVKTTHVGAGAGPERPEREMLAAGADATAFLNRSPVEPANLAQVA